MSEVEGLFHSGKGNQIRQPVREVLNQMDSWNHWPSPAPKKEPLKPKEDAGKSGKAEATNDDPGAFAVLSSPKYFMTTAFMCIAHFVKDFSVFGLAYVFPQYFAGSGKHTVAHHLIVTALLAIPGVAIAVAVMRTSWIGHITAMRTAALLTSLMALGMLEASPEALAVPCASAFLSFRRPKTRIYLCPVDKCACEATI